MNLNAKDKVGFYLYLNVCMGLLISLSSYVHIPLIDFKDYIVYLIHFGLLQFTLFGFTFLFTLNKWIFRIIFSPIFFVLSMVAFWVYTLDISVSVDLIKVTLESKLDIFLDSVSLPFIVFSISSFLVVLHLNILHSKIRFDVKFVLKAAVLAFVSILMFFLFEAKKNGVFKRRMPYVIAFELKKYFELKPLNIKEIRKEIYAKNKIDIVFVLGESVRAKNLELNGYHRETNPLLKGKGNLYSFKNIYTPNTYTSKSIPQILTSIDVDTDKKNEIHSLYSVLNKSGYQTKWIGNQTPEVSYRDFIFENNEVKLIDVEHSVLSYSKKYDGELINEFKDSYSYGLSHFYTIHMIGSHWWYEGRYPKKFKKFEPIANSKYIPSNSKEEMINSYDNTIVYLDYFLNELITFLEKKNKQVVLVYLSDHGETLGEQGKWLHAQNNDASKNPACIVWYSNEFIKNHHQKTENLNANIARERISTDFLYHSILDLIDVKEFEYDSNKSIFNNNP
ncbi:phosphoethanolamine transferase [Wenyingzhuangia sp. IMCC45533]